MNEKQAPQTPPVSPEFPVLPETQTPINLAEVVDLLKVPTLKRERAKRRSLFTAEALVRTVCLAVSVAALVALGIYAVQGHLYTRVPRVEGRKATEATRLLIAAGLDADVAEERYSSAPQGQVLEQRPAAGTRLKRSTPVELVVSAGIEGFVIPDVTGLDEAAARAQLEKMGLQVSTVEETANQKPGTVISLVPSPGIRAHTGDTVVLHLAAKSSSIMLVDFRLSGKRIVIEPRYRALPDSLTASGADLSSDIARRLSSLFTAAGAQVTITRTARERTVPAATLLKRAKDVRPNAYIILTIGTGKKAGIVVHAPKVSGLSVGQDAYQCLHGLMADTALKTTTFASPASPATSVSVRLGSVTSKKDKALFEDNQWCDNIARALYMATGEPLSKGVR